MCIWGLWVDVKGELCRRWDVKIDDGYYVWMGYEISWRWIVCGGGEKFVVG